MNDVVERSLEVIKEKEMELNRYLTVIEIESIIKDVRELLS